MSTETDVYRDTDRFMARMQQVGQAASALAPKFRAASESAGALAKDIAAARTPLGQRGRAEINQTLLRVVGKDTKTPPLDVAASQSFAD